MLKPEHGKSKSLYPDKDWVSNILFLALVYWGSVIICVVTIVWQCNIKP